MGDELTVKGPLWQPKSNGLNFDFTKNNNKIGNIWTFNNPEKKETPVERDTSIPGWSVLSEDGYKAAVAERDRKAAQVQAASVQGGPKGNESAEIEDDDAGEAPAATGQETPEQSTPNSAGKYAGKNKAASTANWADLNGKNFEVIDEPDENGEIPTRPIHGNITVDGEAKNGENPKKFTITDSDNGANYVFELDESVTDKVVYRCVSGPGGAKFTKGNDYELRAINGTPMLVQMKGSEGHGVSVSSLNPAVPAQEEVVEELHEEDELTSEQKQAKIAEDTAAIKTDKEPPAETKQVMEALNQLFVQGVYLDQKPEIKDGEDGEKTATLPDGTVISVKKNADGEIEQVKIKGKVDSEDEEITYKAEGGVCTNGNSLGKEYYNFEKIVELAKRIFGE